MQMETVESVGSGPRSINMREANFNGNLSLVFLRLGKTGPSPMTRAASATSPRAST